MNKFILFLMVVFAISISNAQQIGDYRSNPTGFGGTGFWNNSSDWLEYDGISYVPTASFPNDATVSVEILANHSMVLNANVSVNNLEIQTDAELRNTSGTLYGVYLNGDFVCDGTFGSPTDRIALSLSSSSTQSSSGSGIVYLEFIAKLQNAASVYNHGIDMKLFRSTNVIYCTSNTLTFNMTSGLLEIVNSQNIGGSNVTFNFNGGTVKYSYSGNQTIAAGTYNNLTLSGSGTKSLGGNVTVNGKLSLQGTSSLNLVSSSLTYGGSSILEYAGTLAQVTTSNEFLSVVNLIIDNPSGVHLHTSRTVTGTTTINSGSSFYNEGHSFQTGSLVNYGSISGSAYLELTGNAGSLSGNGAVEYIEINSGGTITLASGSLTISKGLKLTGGTFVNNGTLTLSTGTLLTKNNSVWATPGTVNYSGTIDLNYTASSSTGGELPTSATAINNVTINAPVTLTANTVVNGSLTLNDNFIVGGNTLTIKNPIAGTPTYLQASSGSGSKITFAGTSSGITLPSSISSLHTLVVNNVNGILLQDDLTISNTLTCSNGYLKTNGYNLTWTGSSLTESAGSYVQGILTTTSNVGTGTSTFNGVGVSISAGSDDLGSITVIRYSGPGTAVNVGINSGINRKWEITPSNNYTSTDRTITLSWVLTDDNGKTLNAMRIWQFDNILWKDISGVSQNAVTRNISGVLPDDIDAAETFIFTVTDEFSPLPVELTSFNANTSGNGVLLTWETATEVQNFGFEVERKSEAVAEWKKVGFVAGNGNSNTPNKYSFTDKETTPGKPTLPAGRYSYRLKQVDNDGGYSYSESVNVDLENIPVEFSLDQNYPNPFNPSTTFTFGLPQESHVMLLVYNLLGEKVATVLNETMKEGIHQIKFDASTLSSGMYIYSLEAGNKKFTKKMILTK